MNVKAEEPCSTAIGTAQRGYSQSSVAVILAYSFSRPWNNLPLDKAKGSV